MFKRFDITVVGQHFAHTRQCFSSSSHSNGPTFSSFLVRSLRPMRAKKQMANFEFSRKLLIFLFFFARIGRSDLTRKLEKVGPFECDETRKALSRRCEMLSN